MGGQPQQQNQGWMPQGGQSMPQQGMQPKGGMGYSSPYQGGMNSVMSGLQSTAPMQYMQMQNMPPGPQRDQLMRQAQGSDNGAGFNQAMQGAGYQLNSTPNVQGNYNTYNAPPGGGNTFTGGGSPGYQGFGQGGGGNAKGGGPMKGGRY